MIKTISLDNSASIAAEIATGIGSKLIQPQITYFDDGTFSIAVEEINADDICIVLHVISPPMHDSLFQLLILVSELNALSPGNVYTVLPYLPYSRHDKNPGGVNLILKMLKEAGTQAVFTLDTHFTYITADFITLAKNANELNLITIDNHIFHKKLILCEIPHHEIFYPFIRDVENSIVVAPDKGARTRAAKLANLLGCETIEISKNRFNQESFLLHDISNFDLKHKCCIIVDDIINSGFTIYNTISLLKKNGAINIIVCVTHSTSIDFSSKYIRELEVSSLLTTNSINNIDLQFQVVNIAPIITKKLKEFFNKI
jgi:ribose-phosphate pyrophosphokinase